ncbi:unnamed protein product, partial [Rotaria sordida]
IINDKIILETFQRSVALERVEHLRLYISRGTYIYIIISYIINDQQDLLEEHRDALLYLAQRQTKNFIAFFFHLIQDPFRINHDQFIQKLEIIDYFIMQQQMRRVQIDNQSINSVGLEEEEQHWNYRR